MAKLILSPENRLCFYSHHATQQASIFTASNKQFLLNVLPLKHSIKFRVLSCRLKEKEKEDLVEKRNKLSGFRVNEELDQNGGPLEASASELEAGIENKQVAFAWNWPPWKNLPRRYKLIGTTSLAFVICNMDKVNLSVAIIPMSHQFGWNSSVAGLVQSSFFWGYALSQLPGGWLAKIYGGRKVLEIGVLAWSIATTLVPSLAGFMPGLLASRILVGIGEGVSPSAATDMIARLIPLEERSRDMSFCNQVRSLRPPPNPTEELISAVKQLLLRSLDSPRSSPLRKPQMVRSKSCFSALEG